MLRAVTLVALVTDFSIHEKTLAINVAAAEESTLRADD